MHAFLILDMEIQPSKSSQLITVTQSDKLCFIEKHNDRGQDKILALSF